MKQHIFVVLSLLIIAVKSASALQIDEGGCTGPFIPLGGGILGTVGQPYPLPTCPGPVSMELPECDMFPKCPAHMTL